MNNTQIPIDELYDQLTLILQEEKVCKKHDTTVSGTCKTNQKIHVS